MNLVVAIVGPLVALVNLGLGLLALTTRRRLREALSKNAAIAAALPVGSSTREAVEELLFEGGKRLALAERRRRTRAWWWIRGFTVVLLLPSLLIAYSGYLEGQRLSREMGFQAGMHYAWAHASDPPATRFLEVLSWVAFWCLVAAIILNVAYFASRNKHRLELKALTKTLSADHRASFARTSWATVERGATKTKRPGTPARFSMAILVLLATWGFIRRRD